MRRISILSVLISVILMAAVSLAYYGYSYSVEIGRRERQAILDTIKELATEKVIAIQSAIDDADRAVFDAVDFDDIASFGTLIRQSPHRRSLVLDLDQKFVAGGIYSKDSQENDKDFNKLFAEEILPNLDLGSLRLDQRLHHHGMYYGRSYFFSFTRQFSEGKMYFVVLEWDQSYLAADVFPEFFDVPSPNLYQVVNREGETVYGYAFQGIPAADVVELGFPETLTLWRLRVAQKAAGALASSANRQKTFDLVLIGMSLAVIVTGLLVVVVMVRRERRLSELKSDFISNVSHELKTPLSIISMFGELLAMGRVKSPEQGVEYAEIIRRESERLSRLIDNVLDFAKIERGGVSYELSDGEDLGEVTRRALEISRPRLERAQMSLEADIPDNLPLARIDANAMILAVLNLIDNAIKYAAEGKRIDLRIAPARGGLELTVRDYGPGIPEDEKESIFLRFYRGKSVRLKPVRGSGIGLSLVKHIARAHGGQVEVDTDLDTGCAFRIWIPATVDG